MPCALVLAAACFLSLTSLGSAAPAAAPDAASGQQLARLVAECVKRAIPRQYDKQVDWGSTKAVASGLRADRDGLRIKIRRRKKQVDHGLWKHYRLRVVNPEQDLHVRVANLRPLDQGRAGLTLEVEARLDAWGRAKAYQYGIHLFALEIVGHAQVRLTIDCEVGLRVDHTECRPAVAIDLHVADASLDVVDLRLDRISNARGPIVRELGDGLHEVVRNQLSSAELTEKLNRAIEKRKSRLRMETPKLLDPDHPAPKEHASAVD